MARLFGRTCQVSVEGKQVAALDFTFEVKRSLGFGTGTAKVDIYNLNPQSRVDLEKLYRANLVIAAGYKDEVSMLFSGDLRTPITTRSGADLVTTLEGSDCSWAYGGTKAKISLAPGSTSKDAVGALVDKSGVMVGNLMQQLEKSLSKYLPNGFSFSGNPTVALQRWATTAGFELSIQDGAFQAIQIGKAFAGKGQLLTPETGLVESPTPQRSNQPNIRLWNCKALIRPGLLPGRAVRVEVKDVKADFRIREVTFSGSVFSNEWFAQMVLEDLRYATI